MNCVVISLSMESSTYSVTEGESVEVCVAVENGELERAVQLSVLSHPASAQEEDYKAAFLSLSLWPGDRRICFLIETLEDDSVEGEEAFQLILTSQDSGVTTASPDLTIVSIEDSDG